MNQYYVLLVLQIMSHVTPCALPNVASLLCHKNQCCEPLQSSVVWTLNALTRWCLTPQQNGSVWHLTPPTSWCLMPRLRNGAQPTHDPTISSSPDQTLKSEDNILLNATQTRIKSTIESRSHDCNQLEYPVMFCIKH